MTPGSYATGLPFAFDLIHQAAWARNLEVLSHSRRVYTIRDGQGRVASFVRSMPGSTPMFAQQAMADKTIAKKMLRAAGVQVAAGRAFHADHKIAARRFSRTLETSFVVKPVSGQGGKGVTTNITSDVQFALAWEKVRSESPFGTRAGILVEQFIPGRDHRILVIGGKVIAALRKWPFYLVGDGVSDIAQLIETKREARQANAFTRRLKFTVSATVRQTMQERGLTPQTVLAEGQYLELDTVGNLAAGGESETIPLATVHPGFIDAAVRASQAIKGVCFCGLDLLAQDITKSPDNQHWAVCEVNLNPDISLHHFPVQGVPVDAAGAFVTHFFPDAALADGTETAVVPLGTSLEPWQFNQLRETARIRMLKGGIARQDWKNAQIILTGPPISLRAMLELLADPVWMPGVKRGTPRLIAQGVKLKITRPF